MKEILIYLRNMALLVVGLAIFGLAVTKYSSSNNAKTREQLAAAEARRNDPSIPPELSSIQRDPTWTIKGWIVEDGMPSDCRKAHEFMDKKTYSVTRRTSKITVLDYLHSCKGAKERAAKMVLPQATKWCIYRATDPRLEQLCAEWEQHGDSYMRQFDAAYESTIARFESMTNGYYDQQIATEWAQRED